MHVGLVSECFNSPVWRDRTSPPEIALGGALEQSGVRVSRFGSATAALASEADVLHLHFASRLTYHVGQHARVPYCLTLHDGSHIPNRYDIPRFPHETNRWEQALTRLLSRGAVQVIALCHAEAESLRARDPALTGKVSVIPNGIDVSQYGRARKERRAPVQVLSVGQLAAYKGHEYLLRAFRLLLDRGIDADLRLVSHHSPLLEHFESLAAGLEIAERVAFLPGQSTAELIEEYAAADIFVQPSLSEGAPITVLEAMASGLAIVASDVACMPAQLRGTGLIVPPGDAITLADAMAKLAEDRELSRRLGTRARERCESRFSIDGVAHRHIAIYEGAAATGSPGRSWTTRLASRVNSDAAYKIRPAIRLAARSVASKVVPSWYARRQTRLNRPPFVRIIANGNVAASIGGDDEDE